MLQSWQDLGSISSDQIRSGQIFSFQTMRSWAPASVNAVNPNMTSNENAGIETDTEIHRAGLRSSILSCGCTIQQDAADDRQETHVSSLVERHESRLPRSHAAQLLFAWEQTASHHQLCSWEIPAVMLLCQGKGANAPSCLVQLVLQDTRNASDHVLGDEDACSFGHNLRARKKEDQNHSEVGRV